MPASDIEKEACKQAPLKSPLVGYHRNVAVRCLPAQPHRPRLGRRRTPARSRSRATESQAIPSSLEIDVKRSSSLVHPDDVVQVTPRGAPACSTWLGVGGRRQVRQSLGLRDKRCAVVSARRHRERQRSAMESSSKRESPPPTRPSGLFTRTLDRTGRDDSEPERQANEVVTTGVSARLSTLRQNQGHVLAHRARQGYRRGFVLLRDVNGTRVASRVSRRSLTPAGTAS